jgi:hypothetical protein
MDNNEKTVDAGSIEDSRVETALEAMNMAMSRLEESSNKFKQLTVDIKNLNLRLTKLPAAMC